MKKFIVGSLAALGGISLVSGIAVAVEALIAKRQYKKMRKEDKERINYCERELIMAYMVAARHIGNAENDVDENNVHEEEISEEN